MVDMAEYEKTQATIKLLSKLNEAESAAKDGNAWLSPEDVHKQLGL
jgi:hypothetical protein